MRSDTSDSPLRARVEKGTPLIGTFVKTQSHQTVEVLGRSGLDFVVLDAEHAPFGRSELDISIGAARSVGLPALVRIPDHSPAFINTCLDLGAAGLLVPHTVTRDDVVRIADATKYHRRKRGFSPSGRAGNYGQVDFGEYRRQADAESGIWCQIEDVAALGRLDEIASAEDLDCLFIGPADLAVSLDASGPNDPKLQDAIRSIAEAGQRHGRAVGIFVGNVGQIAAMRDLGITIFVCGSDQSFMLANAKQAAQSLAEAFSQD